MSYGYIRSITMEIGQFCELNGDVAVNIEKYSAKKPIEGTYMKIPKGTRVVVSDLISPQITVVVDSKYRYEVPTTALSKLKFVKGKLVRVDEEPTILKTNYESLW